MNWQPEIDELHQRERLAHHMGGKEKVAKQHAQGRLTVRERIDALLDPGTFHETGALAGTAEYSEGQISEFRPANFVFGTGRINGRKVVVGGDDFTVRGGAADAAIMGKQAYSEQLANSLQLPIVRLVDGTGGGGSVKLLEQHGYTYVPANPGWDLVVDNLSLIPVAAACLGPVAGLGAARLVASHFSSSCPTFHKTSSNSHQCSPRRTQSVDVMSRCCPRFLATVASPTGFVPSSHHSSTKAPSSS